MIDPLADDKLWAEQMGRSDDELEHFYYLGYRMGLDGPHPSEEVILQAIGEGHPTSDAEGCGYRDGRAWAEQGVAVQIQGSDNPE